MKWIHISVQRPSTNCWLWCFDTVGWVAGRAVKNWVVGCWHGYLPGARCRLAYGPADALPLTVSSIKSRLVLLFWVVPDKGPLNGVCVFEYKFYLLTYWVVSVISSPGACILCCVQASYNRSSIVRVEAFVGINCSITSATTYVWRLLNATTHEPLSLAHLNLTQHVFHDPDLFIPPRHLPYGRYVVELRVCAPHWTESSLQEKSLWNFVEPKLSRKMQNVLLVISHLYACIVFQTSPPSIDVLHLLLCGSFLLLSVTILRD